MYAVKFEGLNTPPAGFEELSFTEEGFPSIEKAMGWIRWDVARIIADDLDPDFYGRRTPSSAILVSHDGSSLYFETYQHRGTYSIVDEDGNEVSAEPAKPRICDVLGVGVNEEFSFSSETRRYKRAKVNERGQLIAWDDSGDCWNCVGNHGICWLINHPDALHPLQ